MNQAAGWVVQQGCEAISCSYAVKLRCPAGLFLSRQPSNLGLATPAEVVSADSGLLLHGKLRPSVGPYGLRQFESTFARRVAESCLGKHFHVLFIAGC